MSNNLKTTNIMQYIEVFHWGLNHIAQNHGFKYAAGDEDSACIYGGCNVPTLSDVRMLCKDLGVPSECIESSDFGIDIYYDNDWLENIADREYKPTGLETWKRKDVEIGS